MTAPGTIEELGHSAVDDFARRVGEIPARESWRFHDEARRLETEVLMVFKATVIATRKMEPLEEIASAWTEMLGICSKAIDSLTTMLRQHPDSNAELYRDRLVALAARCQRFQNLHL